MDNGMRVSRAINILTDNGCNEDDAWAIAEAIWGVYRDDSFPMIGVDLVSVDGEHRIAGAIH